MNRLKSIKLYFLSIYKLLFLNLKNFYFQSKFYNKKLITFVPDRIFYTPSTYLSNSLIAANNDFYKISDISPELFWQINVGDKLRFDNLHSFLWLSKLDRKNSKNITKDIIKSWLDIFHSYEPDTWNIEITSKRIIAWLSNIDITLEDSDKAYQEKFFSSVIKQSNFISKNLNSIFFGPEKIIACAAIILSGIIFKENEINYKNGIKELEKVIKNDFDNEGFPKSRNPEEVFISLKYLILIREWFKESQKPIPDFLNEIIRKCGNCYAILSCSNKQFPLFNGATETNYQDYDIFLKNLKYKFIHKHHETSGLIKIKKKKLEFFIDCGDAPPKKFIKNYQAGCLSFELISNKQKIICNSGFGKNLSSKLNLLSRSTAAHSTLYINDTSSCTFQKNKFINKIYGNSLTTKHKVISKNYAESKDLYSITGSHNGFEKKFGYIHSRSIKIFKNEDKIFGIDELKRSKNLSYSLFFFIRFHLYPDVKVVKTQAGNSALISLTNGEGWLLQTKNNELKIEKDIFFGNKNKIINNESIFISGNINKEIVSVEWSIERIS